MRLKWRYVVNVFLITLICTLYFTTSNANLKSVMGTSNAHYRGFAGRNRIAIECAVDWDAEALGAILDILNQKRTTITFCVSGNWAIKNGDILRRMTKDGHEIGLMGMEPSLDGNTIWTIADISESQKTIFSVCGITPTLYYSGTRDSVISAEAAKQMGLLHVVCTVDLLSARGNQTDILNRVLDNPFDGSIILMQPTSAMKDALIPMLEALQKEGLTVVPVGQILRSSG